jgi:hypothetical protein
MLSAVLCLLGQRAVVAERTQVHHQHLLGCAHYQLPCVLRLHTTIILNLRRGRWRTGVYR